MIGELFSGTDRKLIGNSKALIYLVSSILRSSQI